MTSYTWNCPCCGAIHNRLEKPGAWSCPFYRSVFREPPSFVVDGDVR